MKTSSNSPASSTRSAQMPTLLITGATGTIGKELTAQLAERGIPFRAMVRTRKDAEKLAILPGAEVVMGDFNDSKTLAQALIGIQKAFLLTNSSEQAEQQQLAFVAEAEKAGVQHLVKLSQFAAATDSPVRFLRYHALVEEAIRATGITYTFLRPNLFMQGLLGFRSLIADQGKFFAAIGQARISAIDARDIAAVAAVTLIEPGHEKKIYTLTGPQAISHAEMSTDFSTALNRPVTFVEVLPEAMRGGLLGAGFPVWQAEGILEDYAHYSRHEATMITSTVQEITGKAARTFANFARDYAPVFLKPTFEH